MDNIIIKLKWTFIFVIVLFIYSCGDSQSSFNDSKNEIKNKNYKKAILILNDIIKKQPTFDSAYLQRAYAYMKIGDLQNSINDYNHEVANPFFKIDALEGRSSINFNRGDFQNAIDDVNEILKIDKDNYHAYYARGMIKTRFRIRGSNPSSTSHLSDNQGEFYYDYDGALNDFNKSIQINPKFVDTYVQRGNLYEEINKKDKAIEDYSYAIKLDINYFNAYFKRALLYKNLNEIKKALTDFDKAIELEPMNPYPYLNRGYLKLESMNDKDGACKDYRKAEKLGYNLRDEEKKLCN